MGEQRSESLPILNFAGVTKRFGAVTALRRIDLAVQAGDFWAIFGPNGAGKTTLLRLAAGLARPSEGEVRWASQGLVRSRIGYVSHQSLLYADLTGLENLVFFGELYGLAEPRRRAWELLRQMGLEAAADRVVRGYSRGMRQRLSLARALLHDPDLLLLDEPYAGLDQHGARLLTDILVRLRAERRTVLMITHNLREGLELASHLLVLHQGRVVYREPRGSADSLDFEKLYFQLVEH
ncbi:MAG: ABC transporter ATP-binding protein [Acidobacteriota bacterium]